MIKLEDGTQTYVDENLATAKAIWRKNNKEMAELFAVLEPTFANYVSGRREISTMGLMKFERFTGITASRLYLEKVSRLEFPERPINRVAVSSAKIRNETIDSVVNEDAAEYDSFAIKILKRLDSIEKRLTNLEKGTV